jgi:hypothetical protein
MNLYNNIITKLKDNENRLYKSLPDYIDYYFSSLCRDAIDQSYASGYAQAIEDLEELLKGEENVEGIRQ